MQHRGQIRKWYVKMNKTTSFFLHTLLVPFRFATMNPMMVSFILRGPLQGCAERITAAESLLFLLEIIKKLAPRLAELIPKPKVNYIEHFIKSMETVSMDTIEVIYKRNVYYILFAVCSNFTIFTNLLKTFVNRVKCKTIPQQLKIANGTWLYERLIPTYQK